MRYASASDSLSESGTSNSTVWILFSGFAESMKVCVQHDRQIASARGDWKFRIRYQLRWLAGLFMKLFSHRLCLEVLKSVLIFASQWLGCWTKALMLCAWALVFLCLHSYLNKQRYSRLVSSEQYLAPRMSLILDLNFLVYYSLTIQNTGPQRMACSRRGQLHSHSWQVFRSDWIIHRQKWLKTIDETF